MAETLWTEDQWEVIMETDWMKTENGVIKRRVHALVYIPAGQGADSALRTASNDANVDLAKIQEISCKATNCHRDPVVTISGPIIVSEPELVPLAE